MNYYDEDYYEISKTDKIIEKALEEIKTHIKRYRGELDMTTKEMTTKEWLQRAYNIDKQIKSKLELIEMWQNLAADCTAKYGDGAGSPRSNSKAYKYFAMIADTEAEIAEETLALVKTKKEVSDVINKVVNPFCRVLLEQRYLLCHTWERIGDVLGYSCEHVRKRTHPQALKLASNFIKIEKDDRT